jgi:hypothetical protein
MGQYYLKPLLVLPFVVSKSWERPALGVAGVLILIVVPWGGNEEGQIACLPLPDVGAALMVEIVVLRTLALGDQGPLRSWVFLPLAGMVVAAAVATVTERDISAGLLSLIRHTKIFAWPP